jgi:hypothetical protein
MLPVWLMTWRNRIFDVRSKRVDRGKREQGLRVRKDGGRCTTIDAGGARQVTWHVEMSARWRPGSSDRLTNKRTNPRQLGVQDLIFYGRFSLDGYSFETAVYYHGVNCREQRVERCLINGLLHRGRPTVAATRLKHPTCNNNIETDL